MTYPADTATPPFYRPKRLPRVIRRQAPVLLLCSIVIVLGLVAAGVTWRKLTYERLVWDSGHNRAEIDAMTKELTHLTSQIEVESSYARISRWAEMRGWRAAPEQIQVFVVRETDIPPSASDEAKLHIKATGE